MSIASLLLPDMTVDEIRRLNKNLEFFKAVRTQLQQVSSLNGNTSCHN